MFWHCLPSRRPGGQLPCCSSVSSAAPHLPLPHPQGSAYEREQLPNALSRKYSALAAALHDRESMEGVAGARSRPVTGELPWAQRIQGSWVGTHPRTSKRRRLASPS